MPKDTGLEGPRQGRGVGESVPGARAVMGRWEDRVWILGVWEACWGVLGEKATSLVWATQDLLA